MNHAVLVTDGSESAADHRAPERPGRRSGALPFRAALGLIFGLLCIVIATVPLRDIDMFWHLLAGEQLRSGASPRDIGGDWPILPGPAWPSTQWLAEILFHSIHQLMDWQGLALFTLLTSTTTLAVLGLGTLRGTPAVVGAWPFLVAGAGVAIVSNDRPQQFTLVGAALLGIVLERGLASRRLPRWWVLVPGVVLWANLHGGWILAVAVLGVLTIRGAVDFGLRDAFTLRAAALALVAAASGLVSPIGVANATAVLRFNEAAIAVNEWQKVEVVTPLGSTVAVMAGLLLLGWLRARPRPTEVAAAALVLVFGMSAWRNVVPSLLLLAPLVAHRLERAFPAASERAEPAWSGRVGIALACAGAALAFPVALSNADPSDPEGHQLPIPLAQLIDDQAEAPRVLNEYNLSGITLYYGGPRVKVGIDGRTDHYGAEYIERYLDALDLRGDFESVLTELDPNVALLTRETGMAWYLTNVAGWSTEASEGEYVLLRAPVSSG